MPKVRLSEVIVKTERVVVDGEGDDANWIEVRGVSLADILLMLKIYTEDMEALFAEFLESRTPGSTIGMNTFTNLAGTALERFPHLIYKIIAVASDEPDSTDAVSKLRVPVQFFALTKILELSITSEIELKKVVEGLTKSLGWIAALRNQLAPGMTAFGAGFSNAVKPQAH